MKDIHATKGPADPINPSRHSILYFQTGLNSDNINSRLGKLNNNNNRIRNNHHRNNNDNGNK